MNVLPTTTVSPATATAAAVEGSTDDGDGFMAVLAEALAEWSNAPSTPDDTPVEVAVAEAVATEIVDEDEDVEIAVMLDLADLTAVSPTGSPDQQATVDTAVERVDATGDPTIEVDEAPAELDTSPVDQTAPPEEGEGDEPGVALVTNPVALASETADAGSTPAVESVTEPVDPAPVDSTPPADDPHSAPLAPMTGPTPEFTIPSWILAQYAEEQAAARAPSISTADTAAPIVSAPEGQAPVSAPTSVADAMAAADLAALEGDDPWQQLAAVIRPLRQMADGSHRISLQLRPAELGTVHLEVALEDGRLSVRAIAETAITREVLAASLPELRAELTRSGIDLGSVDVGEHTTDGSTTGEPNGGSAALPPTSGDAPSTTTTDPDLAAAPAAAPSGRLDLSL